MASSPGDPKGLVELKPEKARQGAALHLMRSVLAISLAPAPIAFALSYWAAF